MIYNGEFRSVDTTNDPEGQLYKVVICTKVREYGDYYWETERGYIPTQIQLADSPVVVQYEGEDNIYKPYKCSTATVRIMLDRLNNDLICTKKNDVLVMLLKWRNSIKKSFEQGGFVMIDTALPNKPHLQQVAVSPTERFFDPKSYDSYCYDVEWMGYVTPNTYSQAYTNIFEPFELECQDALSTLRYYDYSVDTMDKRSFYDTLTQCLSNIDGVYKHIYITKSVVLKPSDTNNILEKLMCLDGNWFDEDGKAKDCLEVVFQMMQYLNCTMIPYHDDLYIVNYDAIASEQRTYRRITRSQEDSIVVSPDLVAWNKDGTVYLGSRYNIDGLKLAGSATQLSSTSTYRKVEMDTDEYYYDSVIPDINDDNQVEVTKRVLPGQTEETVVGYFDNATLISEMTKFNGVDHNPVYDQITRAVKYAGKMLQPIQGLNNGTIETKSYMKDKKVANWVAGFRETPRQEKVTEFPETYTILGCSIMEYGSFLLPDGSQTPTILKEMFQGYNGGRAFYFHTPSLFRRDLSPNINEYTGDIYDLWRYPINETTEVIGGISMKQPVINQPMLKITTKPLFLKSYRSLNDKSSGQFIAIKGDWTFYNTITFNHPVNAGWNTDINKNLLAQAALMYVWVKICAKDSQGNTKWLMSEKATSGANYSYRWIDTECWCKLFYGGQGYDKVSYVKNRHGLGSTTYTLCTDSDAFETKFSIIKNNFGFNGTVIPVPVMPEGDFYGTVSIEFNRPTGCGAELKEGSSSNYYYARGSILEDFDLKIIDSSETEFFGEEGSYDANGSFSVMMSKDAVDDFQNISSKLSSGISKTTNLSTVYVNSENKNSRVGNISNTGNGITALPEKIKINAIAETYKDPKLLLDIQLHLSDKDDQLIDTFVWDTQFPGKQFVLNTTTIDYEMNTLSASLFEKPSLISRDIESCNITRNHRRNGDNLFNPVPRKSLEVLKDETQPVINKDMDIFRGVDDTETSNRRDLFVDDDVAIMATAIVDPNDPGGLGPVDPGELIPPRDEWISIEHDFIPGLVESDIKDKYPDLLRPSTPSKSFYELYRPKFRPTFTIFQTPTAGLIKKSNVEVNFDNGYAQLSFPNNMTVVSHTNDKGELIVEYGN